MTFSNFSCFAYFWERKCPENSSLAYFCNFCCTFWSPPTQTLFTNIKYVVWWLKKIQENIRLSSKMSGNFLKLIEISKNFKNCVASLEVQYSKRGQIIPKLINLASLKVDFYKFGSNNPNLCFWKIFVIPYFPVDAHCVMFWCCLFLIIWVNYNSWKWCFAFCLFIYPFSEELFIMFLTIDYPKRYTS